MHVDHNMHVIGWNMHVTCTLFRIGFSHNEKTVKLHSYPARACASRGYVIGSGVHI